VNTGVGVILLIYVNLFSKINDVLDIQNTVKEARFPLNNVILHSGSYTYSAISFRDDSDIVKKSRMDI
jgi:hypothetical protein